MTIGKGYSFGPFNIRSIEDAHQAFQKIYQGMIRIGKSNFQHVPSGWTGATNTHALRQSFDTTTVTTEQLAEVVASMIAADKEHGSKQ